MEQMYMLEIFIDKVTVFVRDGDESTSNKNIVIKTSFGPNIQSIFKEGQMVVSENKKDDTIEVTASGRRQYSRTIRVGKSYLFPSYPDTVLTMLAKFPISIEVWTDDVSEPDYKLYIGVGTMYWHTKFFHYLKETANACKLHESLTLKEIVTLYEECCCGRAGEISLILRLSALGNTITTEFQQIMDDPERFCFRTNKTSSMFECKRVEGDNPNFCMIGSLYETTTLEDPDMIKNAQTKIEVCTELASCGVTADAGQYVCQEPAKDSEQSTKRYTINKIRMGDITGPCGNTNCPLAHKVKQYIRNLDTYKTKASTITEKKPQSTKKICGTCACKDDRWHREGCPEEGKKKKEKVVCSGCDGMAHPGDTCTDKKEKHFGTGATPPSTAPATPKLTSRKNSKTQVQLVTSVPNYTDAIFNRDYIVENCYSVNPTSQENTNNIATTSKDPSTVPAYTCCCRKELPCGPIIKPKEIKSCTQQYVYNAEISTSQKPVKVYNVCTEIAEDKDCRCSPPKPSPPCHTFDCSCVPESVNKASRKAHRPYCPLYKHKTTCPVTMMHEEEGEKKEEEEDETEPLPYGLPPIRLAPCPVMGRPCSVPDGFARMYKNTVLPIQPPSYNDAGKICCSKEFERIKKAIKEYMKYQKDNDMRCINRFNVDTEKRCCDKEQVLRSLLGRQCCGTHKMAIQEKYKEEKK